MQIKPTIKHLCLHAHQMVKPKRSDITKCCQEHGTVTLSYFVVLAQFLPDTQRSTAEL